MSRVKVKEVKIPLTSKDDGLTEMFNQMLGTGNVNVNIAYPRYTKMRGIIQQLIKLFDLLARSPLMVRFPVERAELVAFCDNATRMAGETFYMNLDEYGWDLSTVEAPLCKKFSAAYTAMKKSQIVNTFVVMCDRLVPYKRNFADIDKLSHNFINNMGGVEWIPFPFTRLNLKYVMSLMLPLNDVTFIMTVLSRAFSLSFALYTELQAPDIDVDQFVDFIMKNIDAVQNRPELTRCDEAFKKIKESVAMLRERFNGYYRDFISTQDNTIMMQHFILDVSKSGNASPKVAGQFKTIINYYQKIASRGNNNDPRMKTLFERIGMSFKEMDKGAENLVKIDGSDSDDVADSSPLPSPAAKPSEPK